MKRSLLIALCSLLACLAFVSDSFAQPTRIAFVNSDRSAILAKTVGGKLDTLFASGWGKASNGQLNVTKVRNLSVLASTADGKSLLIGGYFIYPNPVVGVPDSVAAFVRIDSPFVNHGGYNPSSTPNTVGGGAVLKIIDRPEEHYTKPLPLGCLSSDGKEWYGIWDKSQGGSPLLWFFHGSFDGKGVIDSVQLTDAFAPIDGYHMSNIIISPDNKTMMAVVVDHINASAGRYMLINWTPSSQIFLPVVFDALIQSAQGSGLANPDWAFGFYFHILPTAQNGIVSAELALDPNGSGDLKLYKMRVQNSSILDLAYTGRKLIRNNIPRLHGTDTLHFFTGDTGNPGGDFDDREVVSPDSGSPYGNGGDLMPSSGGDSIVFITCQKDDRASNPASGIYIYDLQTDIVTPVMNDETRMERQPIFMGSVRKAAPYVRGKAAIDKPSLDLGSIAVGKNATAQVTVSATNASRVILKQAFISGPDASIFTVSPGLTTANDTLKNFGSLTFTVTFTPTAIKSYFDTLIIHYIDSLTSGTEKDSVFAIPLTGTGISAGVETSTPNSFDISVVPNPFTSSTAITVTARQAGSTSVEIRDLLGKEIYSSKSLKLAEGEKFTYSLDASALRLAPGTYFVIVRSGSDEGTRQVIYIK